MEKIQYSKNNIIYLCSCLNSIKINKSELLNVDKAQIINANELCGSEKDLLLEHKDYKNIVIACTQEKKIFNQKLENNNKNLKFVNIRELAGWTKDEKNVTPKILSILNSLTVSDDYFTHKVEMSSRGRISIIGEENNAYDTAVKLSKRLDVTLILLKNPSLPPIYEKNFNIFKGSKVDINGHFGNFKIAINEKASFDPSSKENWKFIKAEKEDVSSDIIIDMLSKDPSISNYKKLKGYYYVEPQNTLKLYRIMFEVTGLIGTFHKPKYIDFNKDLCAHSRNKQIGCTKCLDICPTTAIKTIQHNITIDPFICEGCGNCSASCPTEAITYQYPPTEITYTKIRSVLNTFLNNGGLSPSILFFTQETGFPIISIISRLDKGLDSSTLPIELDSLGQISAELLWVCYSLGASNINILLGKKDEDITTSLNQQLLIAKALLKNLNYKYTINIIEESDPFIVSKAITSSPIPKSIDKFTDFLPIGGKRKVANIALSYLKKESTIDLNVIPLPENAPYGTININKNNCTLCLSCVGVCPTGALIDNKDSPTLSFKESLCVQCSLCVSTCPENALKLSPQLNFSDEAKNFKTLNKEEPFKCVSCSKPFGIKSSINKTIEKLKEHSMFFNNPEALNRLKMCDNCRVIDQFQIEDRKSEGKRKLPLTTDDYKN